MKSFASDGIEIAYLDEGEGEPILLIHGFASNLVTNWVDPGWVRTFVQAGRRVIDRFARIIRGSGSIDGRRDEGNLVVLVAAVDPEVLTIDGDDRVPWIQLAHSNQTEIGKIRLTIREPPCERRQMFEMLGAGK